MVEHTWSWMALRFTALILCSAVALAGCGGGGGGTNAAIAISGTKVVLPSGFSFVGGAVVIQADVVAQSTVTSVQASITKPDGSKLPALPMTLSMASTYTATYNAPMNVHTDGQAETYSIVVTASDAIGNSSSSQPFTFKVPAVDLPEPP